VYYHLQLYYRKTSVDLQRLDAKSRSPISSRLAELLDGLETIKAFRKQDVFSSNFESALDFNTSCMLAFTTSQRWVGLRIDSAGMLVTTCAAILVIVLNDVIPLSGGIAALLINWTLNFSITLQFLVVAMVESEAAITSVERGLQLTLLEPERAVSLESDGQLDREWPRTGEVEFKEVTARYRKDLAPSAKKMSFRALDKERVGICGRTGAGKSTLTSILFRLIECEEGSVILDGVDLAQVGLKEVRGRNNAMCIISQDPVLFSGSVRQAVDVFGVHSDEDVKGALEKVRLGEFYDRSVENGGSNMSAGERQLLCLARALLVKPKLLILDEATVSSWSGTIDIALKEERELAR